MKILTDPIKIPKIPKNPSKNPSKNPVADGELNWVVYCLTNDEICRNVGPLVNGLESRASIKSVACIINEPGDETLHGW